MTEQVDTNASDTEPVSKRTRRNGVVASIGDPNLKDRSKVAPLFLTKKEKQEKIYKKETDKLAQSTRTRMNDWKSVIGVEKDATKVCPVFQRASLSSSAPASTRPDVTNEAMHESLPSKSILLLDPIQECSIIPDPYSTLFTHLNGDIHLRLRDRLLPTNTEINPSEALVRTLDIPKRADRIPPIVNLVTPCKPPSPTDTPQMSPSSGNNPFPDIEKNMQNACILALTNMSSGKHPIKTPNCASQLTEWVATNTRDWHAARLEPRRQHSLAKWLSKWRDEDTAVRRNKIAPVLLVTGPIGSGKTSLVYAAAEELNVQILEVSPADFSWQNNGKRQITEAVKEALQSRQVKKVGVTDSTVKSSQIVLIDDVDVLIKEDKSVLNSIVSMTDDSKRPLVLTCTDDTIIRNSGILVLSDTFIVSKPSSSAIKFLPFAYQYVLHAGIAPSPSGWINREQCDKIAKFCKFDLRRIAIASELKYIETSHQIDDHDGVIPTCIFPLPIPSQLENHSDLIRVLSSANDDSSVPIRCIDASQFDLCDLVLQQPHEVDLMQKILTSVCTANIRGMDSGIGGQLCLAAVAATYASPLTIEIPPAVSRVDPIARARSLVNPFFSRATIASLGASKYRYGDTMNLMCIMARVSNTSEFNSRRVRCLLDQCGLMPEIQSLRDIWSREPPPN